jgi:hypothetical protein
LTKATIIHSVESVVSSINGAGRRGCPHAKKMRWNPSQKKIDSR